MKCPICDGEGAFYESIVIHHDLREGCGACKETGRVSLWWMIKYWFWNIVPIWYIEWLYDITHKEDK